MLIVNQIAVKSCLTRTKLPGADFVVNPYIGCQHRCLYCYADFMKRFTNHAEPWGTFIDIKKCANTIKPNSLNGKLVLLSSVTDPYTPLEEQHKVTRGLLEQLLNSGADLSILTKNAMVVRDIDLFKQFKNAGIAMSMNTLDDGFCKDIEPFASSIQDRMRALQALHESGLHTSVFISPVFPGITDYKAIIEKCRGFVDEFWFENLNLYPSSFDKIMRYIQQKRPDLAGLYKSIYVDKDLQFWHDLEKEIVDYCTDAGVNHKMYFHHKKIVKK